MEIRRPETRQTDDDITSIIFRGMLGYAVYAAVVSKVNTEKSHSNYDHYIIATTQQL